METTQEEEQWWKVQFRSVRHLPCKQEVMFTITSFPEYIMREDLPCYDHMKNKVTPQQAHSTNLQHPK